MDLLGSICENGLPRRVFHRLFVFVSKLNQLEVRLMARTIKTWAMKIKPGRIDDAMELFRAAKKSSSEAEISLLYAESAGDFSGTFTLAAEYPSAAAAGKADDEITSTESGQALWRKFNDADSPVEAIGSVAYTSVDL